MRSLLEEDGNQEVLVGDEREGNWQRELYASRGFVKMQINNLTLSIYKQDSFKGKEKTISLLTNEYRNGHF